MKARKRTEQKDCSGCPPWVTVGPRRQERPRKQLVINALPTLENNTTQPLPQPPTQQTLQQRVSLSQLRSQRICDRESQSNWHLYHAYLWVTHGGTLSSPSPGFHPISPLPTVYFFPSLVVSLTCLIKNKVIVRKFASLIITCCFQPSNTLIMIHASTTTVEFTSLLV